jgi:hypothetical protein
LFVCFSSFCYINLQKTVPTAKAGGNPGDPEQFKEQHREIFDALGVKLGLQSLSGWYNVPRSKLSALGGSFRACFAYMHL